MTAPQLVPYEDRYDPGVPPEQAARSFYEACEFVVERRSELDDQGRPYPLLHMRWAAPNE